MTMFGRCSLILSLSMSMAGILIIFNLGNLSAFRCDSIKDTLSYEPKPGEECSFEISDGVRMIFCWIPSGKAALGSAKEVKNRKEWDKEHEYNTKGFWLGKFPVTQTEWKTVMGENPSLFDGAKDNNAKGMDTSRFPVETVSWSDCQKFLEKINKRRDIKKVFGKEAQFILPDEDQWEYACRGGKGNKQPFYFGNELNGTQANCNGEHPFGTDKQGDFKQRTTEVGSYEKNWPHPWGLCDMHGNVGQWCSNNDEKLREKVCRGGNWFFNPCDCRAVDRFRSDADIQIAWIGFRVCLREGSTGLSMKSR